MNGELGLVALREVSRDEFLALAQNGMRELFELGHYKVVDGSKGEELSHFIYDMSTHACYLVDMNTCYQLLTAFYCGGDKTTLLGQLNKIAASVK
ncbi:hypothetical protein [Halalkalibacter krulwichiae]|uniref:Uncharacterized protein n=1 Tax=Halalkalibacter krulwichiae TaxID=199441 RepID=A0A1X9ML58_9BACI|nr:hypothetical protein [Halalkalibacter krulwichiae]ARK32521.1 hypothetical protein BkAM31D_23105 [Halalkalibacter krulwichiae]